MGMVPDEFEDGTAAFVSAREVAWHGLGTVTPDALTAEEALKTAYLDYTVKLHPVWAHLNYEGPAGFENARPAQKILCKEKWATVSQNPKTGQPRVHGVVGKKYVPIQNVDAFRICDDIVAESGANYETAGAMNDGTIVFLTMKLPSSIQFAEGQETIELYLMATNAHDGSKAFTLAVTPVRVVCQNTLTLALLQAQRTFSIRHTESAKGRIAEARTALDLTFRYTEAFQAEVEKLLAMDYTTKKFDKLVEQLIVEPPKDAKDFVKSRVQEERGKLKGLWRADTQAPIAGTGWAAYNTVVEYADFYSPVKAKPAEKAEARAVRVVNGGADRLKQHAYHIITQS